jgi:hypothetical protein
MSKKAKPAIDVIRNAIIDECARCVPANWCDPLLTGPDKVGDLPARETEALLRGVQDRIRALKRAAQ